MKFARRVQRVAGDGAAAWDIHYQALVDQETDSDVIVLSVGDPDFSTPAAITNAAIKALNDGDTHYTPILGRSKLCRAIAEEFNRHNSVNIDESNVAVLAGAQNALFTASLCLSEPGDEVVTFDPMYLTYEAYIGVSGAEVVRVPARKEVGFRPNLEALTAAITPRTKAIAFANPNNPSGVVLDRNELAKIADIAKQHDLWVISDEVYSQLCFEQDHRSIANLPNMLERTITVNSLSKSHAMTGWRLGWMIAPREMIKHVENMGLCMLYGLPGFVQEAGIEALTNGNAETQRMLDQYRRRRDIVVKMFANVPSITVLAPQAGMFVLLDISATGLSAADFVKQLYKQQKVSLLNGAAFGKNTEHCVRLSFTSNEETLQRACRRIIDFLESMP